MGCALTRNLNSVFSRWKKGLELHISYIGFPIILVIPTTFRKELSNFSTRVSKLPFHYSRSTDGIAQQAKSGGSSGRDEQKING